MPQRWTQHGEHLWVAQSEVYSTNSGVFLDGEEAVLIDPAVLDREIDAIGAFVAERGIRARAIVLTHSHWDHILGPGRLEGVPTIAQERFVEAAAGDRGGEILRQLEGWMRSQGIERAEPFVIPRPDETFETSHTLRVGGLSIRLLHAPGHADDQVVAYEESEGTLWAADMLSDLEIPLVSHSLPAYERTLELLDALEIRLLIPGHGAAAADAVEIRSRLDDDRAYLAELRQRVEPIAREGDPLQKALDACSSMRFRRPEANTDPHRMNVEEAYAEFGGDAGNGPIGWARALGGTSIET